MDDLKETPLRSEQLVDGKLLKVYRDEVRLPDGNTSVREWIDHMGAAAVVPLFEDGTTILLRQYRYGPRRVFLEVPAGKLDEKGEEPVDVAARELEEETGWRAVRFERLAAFHPCIGYSNEIIHFFLAEKLEKGETDLSDGEFVESVRIPFDEAVSMAKAGEMLDMKSVTALLFADAFVRSRS